MQSQLKIDGTKQGAFFKGSFKYKYLLFITWAIMAFHYGWIPYESEKFADYDLHKYLSMANSWPAINLETSKPFAFRILGPWLAGSFSFNPVLGFKVLSVVFSLATILLLFEFLRLYKVPSMFSLWACFLYLSNVHFFGFHNWNYFQLADNISSFFIVLIWIFFFKKKYITLGLTLFLSLLAKETTMVFVPVFMLHGFFQGNKKRELGKILWALFPACLLFIALRVVIPTQGGAGLLEAFSKYWIKIFIPETWYRLGINALLPLSLLPFMFYKQAIQFFKSQPENFFFLGLICLSCLLGSNNERLLAPIFPIWYLFLAQFGQKHLVKKELMGIAIFCFLSSFHHNVSLFPWDGKIFTIGLSLFCLLGVSLILVNPLKRSLRVVKASE